MRLFTPAPIVCCLLSIGLAASVFARVGESQEDFERRILQPDLGKFLPKDRYENPDREIEIKRQQPFNEVRAFFPDTIRERKYWKSAVPNMLSNENGWKIHVFFQESQSALEAYQRIGNTLSEFEIRNILEANQGTSEWHRVEADSFEGEASSIGCDYQLVDGSLRAKVSGNWLMVYATSLDNYVKERRLLSQARRANEQEERLRQQQRAAPGSTSGF